MAADSSSSAQRRRATKPLIEKRRRARINSSLAQLKEIVAKPTSNAQETRSNRLEKADILEMTVEYVKKIHNRKNITDHSYPSMFGSSNHDLSFKEGYRLCMSEVQNFFSKNYQQQASKQYLNRSIQNYLQEILQKALRDTSGTFRTTAVAADLASEIPTKYHCRTATSSENDAEVLKKNEYFEFQSENSDFSCNYSSASTDDETTETFITPEPESNRFLLNGAQRLTSHYNRSDSIIPSDKMWRPW